jgi:hypothetical protein
MLSERFEDDMAEISGDGYLMLCQGRQKVFMEGTDASPLKLADVSALRAAAGAILVERSSGDAVRCPFTASSESELQPVVDKLNQCLARWREAPSS